MIKLNWFEKIALSIICIDIFEEKQNISNKNTIYNPMVDIGKAIFIIIGICSLILKKTYITLRNFK